MAIVDMTPYTFEFENGNVATYVKMSPVTPAEEVARIARKYCPNVKTQPDPEAALEEALCMASPADLLCVTGSMSLVGELRGRTKRT